MLPTFYHLIYNVNDKNAENNVTPYRYVMNVHCAPTVHVYSPANIDEREQNNQYFPLSSVGFICTAVLHV